MKCRSGCSQKQIDLLASWSKTHKALVELTDRICNTPQLCGCSGHAEIQNVLRAAVRLQKLGDRISTYIAKECDLQKVKGQFIYEELQSRVIDDVR